VDLPPVSAEVVEPWLGNALQHADGALLVLDLSEPDCVELLEAVRRRLEEKHVLLVSPESPQTAGAVAPAGTGEEALDLFRVSLKTALLANKAERLGDPATELAAFRELTGLDWPALAVSAETGLGLSGIGPLLFSMLGVVRVYGKAPGHAPDRDRPFTLRRGATVRDVARLVHRELARDLRFARIWGGSVSFAGEQVSAEHAVSDGDVVELHA